MSMFMFICYDMLCLCLCIYVLYISCFESDTWKELFHNGRNVVVLDKVFRQKEPLFTNILNELRRGYVSATTKTILMRKVEEAKTRINSNSSSSSKGGGGGGGGGI